MSALFFRFLLCVALWFAAGSGALRILNVDNVADSYVPLASYCSPPTSSGSCNLRSAWTSCHTSQEACEITLPNISTIALNSTFGSLALSGGSNITIFGQGAVIAPVYQYLQFITYTSDPGHYYDNTTHLALVNMTLFGFGSGTILNGGALMLDGDAQVEIHHVTFRSNIAENGGAVYITRNAQPVNIANSDFLDCRAVNNGGAVNINNTVSRLRSTNNYFHNCTGYKGGAVAVMADNPNVLFTGCHFESCRTTTVGSTVAGPTMGGALYFQQNNSNAQLLDCVFRDCQAGSGGAVCFDGQSGGNMHALVRNISAHSCTADHGGGVYFNSNNDFSVIVDATFSNCSSTVEGGAISYAQSNNHTSIVYVRFRECNSTLGGAVSVFASPTLTHALNMTDVMMYMCTAHMGGGIYLNTTGTVHLSKLSIANCTALEHGGAIYSANSDISDTTNGEMLRVVNSDFTYCRAGLNGGAIYANSLAALYLYNISFAGCTALGEGGGLYAVSVSSVTVEYMLASECAAQYGGAAYFYNTGPVSLKNMSVSHCHASSSGGAIYAIGFTADEINVSDSDFTSCVSEWRGGAICAMYMNKLNLNNVRMVACRAVSAGGGMSVRSVTDVSMQFVTAVKCSASSYSASGGAMGIESFSSLSMHEVNIANCTAALGGGVYLSGDDISTADAQIALLSNVQITSSSAKLGGALCLDGTGTVSLTNLSVSHCHASNSGGAIYSLGDDLPFIAVLRIMDSHFSHSSAFQRGGAIYVANSNELYFFNVDLESCASATGGGLMVSSAQEITVQHTRVFNCTASTSSGGAMSINYFSALRIDDVEITHSRASTSGGGLYLYGGESSSSVETGIRANVSNILIRDCATTTNGGDGNGGGGVHIANSNGIVFANSTVSNCSSSSGGGAYIFNSTYITFLDLTVADNDAKYNGGGIYFADRNAHITLGGLALTNNVAGQYGGGVYLSAAIPNLVVTDMESAEFAKIVQSAGLSNGQETIVNPLATGFVINFDPLFNINDGVLYIDASSGGEKVEEYSYTSASVAFPGVNAPSLIVYGTNLAIYFTGNLVITASPTTMPSEVPSASATDLTTALAVENHPEMEMRFGPMASTGGENVFTLYVTPIIADPKVPSRFVGNQAGKQGGGIYMFQGFSYPLLLNSHFHANAAGIYGGGLYFYADNLGIVAYRLLISNNTAFTSGGGLYLYSDITGLVLQYTNLTGNSARASGGGMYINFNTEGRLYNCRFTSNVANSGGALVLHITQRSLSVDRVVFAGNRAQSNGGAVYLDSDNGAVVYEIDYEIVFSKCTYANNYARLLGGAVFAGSNNVLTFQSSLFEYNVANSGGALYFESSNAITLASNDIVGNIAALSGGGVVSASSGVLTIHGGTFVDNSARVGGGLYYAQDAILSFQDVTTFEGNNATQVGGAIAAISTFEWNINTTGHLFIRNNAAQRGSGLFAKNLKPQSKALSNITFSSNDASVGGTVYWIYDNVTDSEGAMVREPTGLHSLSVTWYNNSAPYGNRTATQAVKLLGPTTYNVDVYLSRLRPPLMYGLQDAYGQNIPLFGDTTVVPTVVLSETHCGATPNPSIVGSDILGVPFEGGVANFSALQGFCYPGGSMMLYQTAQLGDKAVGLSPVQASAFYVHLQTLLLFRNCSVGEFIRSGACVLCPIGSFSLTTPVNEKTQCSECGSIAGVHSCQQSEIVVERGYWRRHPYSTAVQLCPTTLSGCAGGSRTGDDACEVGFTGPLCAVCSEGYFPAEQQCLSCGSQALPTTTVVFILIFALSLTGAAVYLYRRYHQLKRMTPESPVPLQRLDSLLLWCAHRYRPVVVKLKITVATYQIVTAIPAVFSVTMPSSFTSFLHGLNVVNLNFANVLSLQCTTNYTYIDKLIVITLMPIGLTLLLFVVFLIQVVHVSVTMMQNPHRKHGEMTAQKNRIKNKYLNYFFYLTYLVLPSVTTHIFQTFLCTNIDPLHETTDENNSYLTADMSISCKSDYYYRGRAYAIFMIFVYPIGIPCMYMYLLNSHRIEIQERLNEADDEEGLLATEEKSASDKEKNVQMVLEEGRESEVVLTENPMMLSASGGLKLTSQSNGANSAVAAVSVADPTAAGDTRERSCTSSTNNTAVEGKRKKAMSAPAARLAFLWAAYEPRFWYWEVIETYRRLMLTAVLSITAAGTSKQAVLALLLAILYIKLYSYFTPYEADPANITAEIGQYQILFTFLGALITMDSLLGSGYNSTVGGLLIVFNLGVICAFGYFELTELLEENARERDEARAENLSNRELNGRSNDAGIELGDVKSPAK